MIMSQEFHWRYHASTSVVFNTHYPGCVADEALFRDAPKLFQQIFSWFQKNTPGATSRRSWRVTVWPRSSRSLARAFRHPLELGQTSARADAAPFAQALSAKATNGSRRPAVGVERRHGGYWRGRVGQRRSALAAEGRPLEVRGHAT